MSESNIALLPTQSAVAMRLARVMQSAGWEIKFVDLDLTAQAPKADIRVMRDSWLARHPAAPTPTASTPKADGEASRFPFAGYDPKFCSGSNPDNPQEWPDATQLPSEADRTREGGDVDSEGASHV